MAKFCVNLTRPQCPVVWQTQIDHINELLYLPASYGLCPMRSSTRRSEGRSVKLGTCVPSPFKIALGSFLPRDPSFFYRLPLHSLSLLLAFRTTSSLLPFHLEMVTEVGQIITASCDFPKRCPHICKQSLQSILLELFHCESAISFLLSYQLRHTD